MQIHPPSACETVSLLAVVQLLVKELPEKHTPWALPTLPAVGWSHLEAGLQYRHLVTTQFANYPGPFTSVPALRALWLFLCLLTPESKGGKMNMY